MKPRGAGKIISSAGPNGGEMGGRSRELIRLVESGRPETRDPFGDGPSVLPIFLAVLLNEETLLVGCDEVVKEENPPESGDTQDRQSGDRKACVEEKSGEVERVADSGENPLPQKTTLPEDFCGDDDVTPAGEFEGREKGQPRDSQARPEGDGRGQERGGAKHKGIQDPEDEK